MKDTESTTPEDSIGKPDTAPETDDQLETSSGKRVRHPWIVAAVVLVLLIGAFVGGALLADETIVPLVDSYFDDPGSLGGEIGLVGMDQAVWSGNGAYGVIQYHRDYTYPSVAVWDRKTGATRTLDGYRVLFVEPYAPVVWMEPVTDEQADDSASVDGLGDALDHRPARMVAWRLDDGSEPTDNVPAKWGAWPGPVDSVAYLEISPLKGVGPSALLFNNKASHGEGVKGALPESTGTFIPVGWSASGRYFAVEELVDEESMTTSGTAGDSAETTATPRNVIVFDATTGEVSAIEPLPLFSDSAPIAMWDGTADRIFWLAKSDPDSEFASVGIRSMTATGPAGDAFADLGWGVPAGYRDIYTASVLGWDPEGPLFAVDGDIWRLTSDGPAQLGMLYPQSGVWHPAGGLLAVTTEFSSDDGGIEWPEAQLTDIHGGDRKTIWKGPAASTPRD